MHFFEVYKQLEGKKTTVDKVYGRDEAEKIIKQSIESYKEKFNK
jgi:inorganic pyrophosphatase